ncbi:glutathione hydrolase 5 proenzyme-like [Pygocentrus nattereri]|uniref:Glutathione hydrolase n=1 Tax=Pygocentrus nattereri TaxID=42514 RepID=A0A3B4D483_PYGNA|nr:glutathione hydrolase 5 proenzyme-like [Pygocentrus nattereri]
MARRRERVCACMSLLILIVVFIIIIVACSSRLVGQDCEGGSFKKAAVAADSETCSQVGRDVLQEGGTAVDGAVAALICTSVINPQSMGIGGGVIFTVMETNGKVKIINARETAPKLVKANLLSECSTNVQQVSGSQWIGVPGEIRGYERVHRLYGRLPWSRLFQPTIRLAREGFKMPNMLSRVISYFSQTPLLKQLFVDAEGKMLKEGDIVKFEKLADTLEKIAERGANEFYTGETARDLISDIEEAGGTVTMEDLRSFEVFESEAWKVPLGNYIMYFPPPPAGGAALSFILNVMQGYILKPASVQKKEDRELTYQRYVEACKFANGLKRFMRDPRFGSDAEAFNMTQKEFADHIRKKITDDRTHDAQYYNVTPGVDTPGTTHVSVLDEHGMAVSVTSTINHIFGSKVYSPRTGIILNNELSDFCGKTNHIHPGEQPPSSMAPVILHSKTEENTIIIGGSGGSMITTAMAMTLMNYLWFGKNLDDSISAPVVYVDGKNALKFEPHFDKDVIEALRGLGHTVEDAKLFFNVVNGISKQEGECIDAVSDARKMGKPAGY